MPAITVLGTVAVTVVSLTKVKAMAEPPIFTEVTPVKEPPLIVTSCEVPAVTLAGVRLPTKGAAVKVKRSGAPVGDVPLGVTTVTSTAVTGLTGKVGLMQVIDVELTTTTLVAGIAPKKTAVAPVKLVPVTVTAVPPTRGPVVGLRPVTVGAGGSTVNWSAVRTAEVPAAVVTVKS